MYKMSDVQRMYQEKLVTAEEAARHVEDGDRIYYGFACSSPTDIDRAIGERVARGELKGIEGSNTLSVRNQGYQPYEMSSTKEECTWSCGFAVGLDRRMIEKGRDWFIPNMLDELASYWRRFRHVNCCIVQCTPMDEYGNFNLGPSIMDLRGALETADKVFLEVNENMPRAFGIKSDWNIADTDFVVEGSNSPIAEIPFKEPDADDKKIAEYIAELVEDGSTLQLGIGGIPMAIGKVLADSDVKDLSGHTEMLGDPYVDLYEAGKITSKKPVNYGKITYAFAGGTKRLYDFLDDNQICQVAPVEYVNNFITISSIPKFVSVNGCLNVDLFGQVCSETDGYRHISGTGGQLDYALAAYHSEGGKSFLALHSTRKHKDGTLESLIRPYLKPGSVVTTPRSCVHYIVTEYGAVNLKGKNNWERTEAIISIAHPDFRDELIKEAEKAGIWTNTSRSIYI